MTTLAAWSITYVVHSTLLIALAWLASRVVRSASARDTLWKLALLGGIVTATLQIAGPVESVMPAKAPKRITMTMAAPSVRDADVVEKRTVDVGTDATGGRGRPPLLGVIWMMGVVVLLARIVVGRRRFLARVGERVEILRGDDRELLDHLAIGAGIERPIRLSESAGVRSPIAMLGWEIVVPAGVFPRLSAPQRETILAHELAHLMRRDPLWLTIAEVVKALLFFQPLNWIVETKMKETAEFLCDDAAVLQTGNRKALAETLAELASSLTTPVVSVAAMAEGGSSLIARVSRVLRSEGRPDSPLRLPLRFAIAALVVALTAAFAPGMTVVRATAFASPRPKHAADHVSHFDDGDLSRTFDGPEGDTNIHFLAHHATIPSDASWFEFDNAAGYVKVRQVTSTGPVREVEIRPGRDLAPVYRYRVDGIEKPWCDDAKRIVLASFAGQTAFSSSLPVAAPTPPSHTWNATVELTGTTDGTPTYLHIQATNIRYDDAGEVTLDRSSSLKVQQRIGTLEREFTLTEGQNLFHTTYPHDTLEKQTEWLRRVLRENAKLPRAVIESMTRF